MDGYFLGGQDQKGVLRVSVTNIDVFNALVEDAEEKARQAKEAVDRLSQFEIEFILET